MIIEHVALQRHLITWSSGALSAVLLLAAAIIVVVALLPDHLILKSIVAAYVLLP